MSEVRRICAEKLEGFNIEACRSLQDIRENLNIKSLENLRLITVYDCEGLTDDGLEACKTTVFSEPSVDRLVETLPEQGENTFIFGVKYLPGQFDQRADSAVMCILAVTGSDGAAVETSRLFICEGRLSGPEKEKIKRYFINPVDSAECPLTSPENLCQVVSAPEPVRRFDGFTGLSPEGLAKMKTELGLAMSYDDLAHCQSYFRNKEKRDPSHTEIKVIDTYWSDHCRHTTFLTKIEDVSFDDSPYREIIEYTYRMYLSERESIYGGRGSKSPKKISLMDLATIGMKTLKKQGYLDDLDESEEINACSINIDVTVDGKTEKWLLQFKNETHNHPTEIEPFGGAATCLGGAIRDPLSGRAYVYQAMRVTGSGDPRVSAENTLPGKLPQRKLTVTAAAGYSSYGNQVGVATGQVTELYDEGYVAKRMEIGAVVGAVKKENVRRETPAPGDAVILIGGRTGRDGCGGATGSSKAHDEESILGCGAEVQKGNPPAERKLQRLFRNPKVLALIKRCNDFGAGGVSVAIGELADGLDITLDNIPKKYEGLSETELAISESQERMAVVVEEKDAEPFISLAREENLEATVVAKITGNNRLRMFFSGEEIVNLSRDFLNTNGAESKTTVKIGSLKKIILEKSAESMNEALFDRLGNLKSSCQKGLVECFDSTVGGLTVLMPFGGKNQLTPAQAMAALIPVENGRTTTASLMAFGFDPVLANQSCFHSAVYAVVEAVSKIVASGGRFDKIRMSFQEYFESPGTDPYKWGKPFSALLGAYLAQMELKIPSIGGKDSMSGNFNELCVPPTLAAFAVTSEEIDNIISPEFKAAGNNIYYVRAELEENNLPNFAKLIENFRKVRKYIEKKSIVSAYAVEKGGLPPAIAKMCFGNMLGAELELPAEMWFSVLEYGSFVVESAHELDFGIKLGKVTGNGKINVNGETAELSEALKAWIAPLESVFPTRYLLSAEKTENSPLYEARGYNFPAIKTASPRVFIPVFPGSNCEYETVRAYEESGANVKLLVMKNLSLRDFEASVAAFADEISQAQIISIPGGFSAGDEPEGSGKFIAAVFRNKRIAEAVSELLEKRDGLILGVCNGFQALVKLGLIPSGKIEPVTSDSPTLTFNKIGRHISCLARTKVTSRLSPWMSLCEPGEINMIAASHGEGRFVISEKLYRQLSANGQIAAQYVDFDGNASMEAKHNPNGSMYAIEAVTSPDGRVLGKMAHTERYFDNLYKNVPGNKIQRLYEAGVRYFK